MGVPVIEVPGVGVTAMTAAICEVLPLDPDFPPALMDSKLSPAPAVQAELVAASGADEHRMVERWDYYPLAREAVAIVRTGEKRTWANVILAKGVVRVTP